MLSSHPVIPAKAGIHFEFKNSQKGKSKSHWIPAFAGMTIVEICHPERGEGSSCSLYISAGFFAALRMTCSERLMDIGYQSICRNAIDCAINELIGQSIGLLQKPTVKFRMVFQPLAAPSSTAKVGVFGEDCLRIENPSSAVVPALR